MNLRNRARVVATVTVLSGVAGAVAGLGIGALVYLTRMTAGQPHYIAGELFSLGSQTGAVLGLILGPLSAFTFMRRVDLGRLFTSTALGAARGGFVGFAAGALLLPSGLGLAAVLAGAVAGFGVAASKLWWRARMLETAELTEVQTGLIGER